MRRRIRSAAAGASVRVEFQVHFRNGRNGHKELREGKAAEPPLEQGNVPRVAGLLALAHHFDELLGDGVVRDYAELAAFVKWRWDALTSRSAVSHRYLTRADVPHEGNSLWGDGSGGRTPFTPFRASSRATAYEVQLLVPSPAVTIEDSSLFVASK